MTAERRFGTALDADEVAAQRESLDKNGMDDGAFNYDDAYDLVATCEALHERLAAQSALAVDMRETTTRLRAWANAAEKLEQPVSISAADVRKLCDLCDRLGGVL